MAPPDELTAAIARHVVECPPGAADAATADAARGLILDVLGAQLAGVDADGCVAFRDLMCQLGGRGEATAIGAEQRLPAHVAAAVNAAASRALEVDDVHEQAVNHVSATVVPVALACAELSEAPVTGRDLLDAVIIGSDVAVRMSLAARPLTSWEDEGARRGMSTTYQVGTFAAAMTAARLLRLSVDETVHALGYAYSGASGNQQGTYDGALSVRIQQGQSAGAGLLAARLAGAGLTAATRCLEGKAGYYTLYWRGQHDRTQILHDLGKRFLGAGTSVKPYPCCKCSHNAVSAVLQLRESARFDHRDVASVDVVIPSREYFYTVCHPTEEKRRPGSRVAAQFSLPFAVAVALRNGWPSLQTYVDGLEDPDVMELITRVECSLGTPDVTEMPAPATVAVRFRDGRPDVSATVTRSPGHPDMPMSWTQLTDKFHGLADFPGRRISDAARVTLLERLESLQDVPDVARGIVPLLNARE